MRAPMKPSRECIIGALMWEICKNSADAAAEFDRTMGFIAAVIESLKASDSKDPFGSWTTVSGVRGRVRRGPVGVTMMLAPFNYPLNEMYAMMIPALLMGNIIVLKLPAVGGLAHILTIDALMGAFPAGVVNFVTGAGRKTMGPIMSTGLVDCLGFIGGAKATDALIGQHPQPHRLKVFSQLEGKNIAIVLADADLEVATKQILLGSLTYNGQRCTACKLIMAHASIADALTEKLAAAVNSLKKGLPWEGANITPLPEPTKPAYLEGLIADALGKGARLVNADAGGGNLAGALFTPAVLYPVDPTMRAFSEEQFGPVVPIARFSEVSEVDAAVRASWNGQQAAIFTASPEAAAPLVDMLSAVVGRINLNAQCSRGPDVFPFSGRRSSAMGTMSVTEALRAFSVETIAAFPDNELNRTLAEGVEAKARFLQPIDQPPPAGGAPGLVPASAEPTPAPREAGGVPFKCSELPAASVSPEDEAYKAKPDVDGCFKFIGGQKHAWAGETIEVTSPIVDSETGTRTVIGKVAAFGQEDSVQAVEAAAKAWDKGQGPWAQASLADRIAAMERFVELLGPSRESIVNALMWEICKNSADAAAEFDRTMGFIAAVIQSLKSSDSKEPFGSWTTVSGVRGRVRRGPVGVTMMLAPFNYPLNEMYAMMIPALLMGNIIVLKLPAVGGLAHILTIDALMAAFPAGVVNFVTGAGRKTMGPIMSTGLVDCLGFIGGAKATDALIKQHPRPHRLKVFSQLEGKNIAVVLPDADLDVAAKQILLGSLTYNGQRCTACKLIMAHDSISDALTEKLVAAVNGLKKGLPWEGANITPLPEPTKPDYLEGLIADALGKGAKLVNADAGGGSRAGALFTPAVVYPVDPTMRAFSEEQFGPVVPIAKFSGVLEVDAAVRASWNGQQAAIFTNDPEAAAPLVDMLSAVVGRINLNAQCSRGPDVFPFSGRRSSAMGTMSVTEALRAFSVETIVAFPDSEANRTLAEGVEARTRFLRPITAL